MKKLRFVLPLLLVALGVAAAWHVWAPRIVPLGQPPLATLDAGTLQNVRADFNRDAGTVRVIVLLSPT
jgi:hypothetical protein